MTGMICQTSKILTVDFGEVPLKDLRCGTKIYYPKSNGLLGVDEVKGLAFGGEYEDFIEVKASLTKKVVVTQGQKVLTFYGPKIAKDLEIDEIVRTSDYNNGFDLVRIVSLNVMNRKRNWGQVFLANQNTYIANGIVMVNDDTF